MRPAPLIGLITIVTVVVEVTVFVGVQHLIGFAWALTALIVLSVAGGWLVPRQGVRGWRRFRAAAEAGRPPGPQVTDGLVGLFGAALLAVPGFVTDLFGVLLLVPPVRRYAGGRLERGLVRRAGRLASGDLFGPRRVRVRRTPRGATAEPATPDGPAPSPPQSPPPAGRSSPAPDVIDGEIVDEP